MLAREMSESMGVSEEKILEVAGKADFEYKTFLVNRPSGKKREVHHPSRALKALQYWLLDWKLRDLQLHPAAMAYRKAIFGPLQNAELHKGTKFLIRLDIEGFFPAIDASTIISSIGHKIAIDRADLGLFTKIVCRRGSLVIGAPTSPMVSNLVCFDVDVELAAVATKRGWKYSRYADDIFFSTDRPNELSDAVKVVTDVFADHAPKFSLNPSKTHHMSPKGRRQVTGIVLTQQGKLAVGRERKRKIRSLLHNFDSLQDAERKRLGGLISFARQVEPEYVKMLRLKYRETMRVAFPSRSQRVCSRA